MRHRVLVIEDDPDVGEALLETLGEEGYEVALARDGQQALAWLGGHQLPDVILLDRRMPNMDGYEFRRRQLADPGIAPIPTVVVSAGPIDQPMAATRPAAWLQKPMRLDTLSEVVKRFCSPDRPSPHQAIFFRGHEALVERVSSFLAQGLEIGEATVTIATAAHRDGIRASVIRRGFNLNALEGDGRALFLDAGATLDQIHVGRPGDEARFAAVVGAALDRVSALAPGKGVRAFGEMVDLLWRAGDPAAALRLEALWHGLAKTRSFSLLCAYERGGSPDASADESVRRLHSTAA